MRLDSPQGWARTYGPAGPGLKGRLFLQHLVHPVGTQQLLQAHIHPCANLNISNALHHAFPHPRGQNTVSTGLVDNVGRLNNVLPEEVLRRSDHLSDVVTGEGALNGDDETVGVKFQPLRKPERFREKMSLDFHH